ncbi:DUF6314 family protein [Streptomyces sp. B15]|uniref:DUF6314 family protein n=1 Tax=Streptomyces sp. B15 TaxID=1537797 RepID=UPI001B37F2B2|nr:DUF6314 family protein [Streptomyces sp. B15]MBQ1123943.1 hypothetical protein [Streptomyces sp. B15]
MPHPPGKPLGCRPHRVTDSAGYLAGLWSIERVVIDRRTETEGSFRGSAEFRAADAAGVAGAAEAAEAAGAPEGALLHREEGQLTWGGRSYPATRVLCLLPRPDGTAEVTFADGRHFHELDLRSGDWSVVHLCAADRYEGRFTVCSPDEWHLQWRIIGPAKEQLLQSVYRRRVP